MLGQVQEQAKIIAGIYYRNHRSWLLRHGIELDDLTQEAFLAGIKKIKSWNGNTRLNTFLAKPMMGSLSDLYRKYYRRFRVYTKPSFKSMEYAGDIKVEEDSTTLLSYKELRSAVNNLEKYQKTCIELFYLQELDAKEVSKLMGFSVKSGYAHQLRRKALNNLRTMLVN